MSDAGPAPGLTVAQPSTPCRHLRNSGMYIYTDSEPKTGHDGYDNTIFWCLKSMKDYGPDDQPVDGPDCRNCGRSCYEAY